MDNRQGEGPNPSKTTDANTSKIEYYTVEGFTADAGLVAA